MRIIEFNADDVINIAEMATRADAEGKPLRLMVRDGRVIFKVGGGTWTPDMGYYVDENYQRVGW